MECSEADKVVDSGCLSGMEPKQKWELAYGQSFIRE